jgi:hypothetical protein
MADARLPERYLADRRILRLTDAERSSLFMATTWSVSNRTDGRIERADLPLIPTFQPSAIAALVSVGIWVTAGADAWVIADYARDQTTRTEFEILENARRREREKKRRQRSKSPETIPGDSPPGQHRQGKARQVQEPGQDDGGAEDVPHDAKTGELTDWPVRTPGAPQTWSKAGAA